MTEPQRTRVLAPEQLRALADAGREAGPPEEAQTQLFVRAARTSPRPSAAGRRRAAETRRVRAPRLGRSARRMLWALVVAGLSLGALAWAWQWWWAPPVGASALAPGAAHVPAQVEASEGPPEGAAPAAAAVGKGDAGLAPRQRARPASRDEGTPATGDGSLGKVGARSASGLDERLSRQARQAVAALSAGDLRAARDLYRGLFEATGEAIYAGLARVLERQLRCEAQTKGGDACE